MKHAYSIRLKTIRQALEGRDVVWFGTRGVDAEPLLNLVRPLAVISQIAPLPADKACGIEQDCLESRTNRRVDLDIYDIDLDFSREAVGLKLSLLRSVSSPVALIAYRAAEFLASIAFTDPMVQLHAPFHLCQRQLEHKPWVECNLSLLGIPVIPWTYIRDGNAEAVNRVLEKGPAVGRTNTGAGGAGVFTFSTVEEFQEKLPIHNDGFVGVSPYFENAIPLNVNACVYRNGETTVFAISYQLIGIKDCSWRRMGYCGNDFAAAAELPKEIHDRVEQIAKKTGQWLHRLEFQGVFGLDLLLHDGNIMVSEINPRFQGSTSLCARLNQSLGITDPFAEHIASFLGLKPPDLPSCREQRIAIAESDGSVAKAQVIYHNINSQSIRVRSYRLPELGEEYELACVPDRGIYVDPHAIIAKSIHFKRVTGNGYTLEENATGVRKLMDIGY